MVVGGFHSWTSSAVCWWLWNCLHGQNFASGQNRNYGWGEKPTLYKADCFLAQEGWAEGPGCYFPKLEHFHSHPSNCTSPDPAVSIITNRIRGKIFVGVQTDRAKDAGQEKRSGERRVPEKQLGDNFSVSPGCRFSDSVLWLKWILRCLN